MLTDYLPFTFSSISFLVRFLLPCFLGIAAYVLLTQAGAVMLEDPKTGALSFVLDGEEHPSLRGMPVFLREMLPIGVLGLLTAGMLAACERRLKSAAGGGKS